MKRTIKGSHILSKLQGSYAIVEERGYGIRYEVMHGTLKECFAWIRRWAPVRCSDWYHYSERPAAIDDCYCNPFDDDMLNGDGRPMFYHIDRVA